MKFRQSESFVLEVHFGQTELYFPITALKYTFFQCNKYRSDEYLPLFAY